MDSGFIGIVTGRDRGIDKGSIGKGSDKINVIDIGINIGRDSGFIDSGNDIDNETAIDIGFIGTGIGNA
jgi:hypothetical protein